MPEIEITGQCASAGLARGTAVEITPHDAQQRTGGHPDEEARVLRAAMALAADQLQEIIGNSDKNSAEIIEFQWALLMDDELSAPAFAAITGGSAAHDAWNATLNAEISGYLESDDAYFRARAADLEDLRARVITAMSGGTSAHSAPPGSILFAADLAPSTFLSMDWQHGGALVLSAGSQNSHLAMLARSRGIPMLVGANWPSPLPDGALALVDALRGQVIVAPTPATLNAFEARFADEKSQAAAQQQTVRQPAISKDGQRILVNINIATADELPGIDPQICDGIGLVRTEFLFEGQREFPDETTQYQIYARILDWAAGRPVVIRTLDAGADKPLPGLTIDGESNPFLGVRGIRLSLARPDIFRVQLRALLRAAVHGDLRIMLPMVAAPEEISAVSKLLDEELQDLQQHGIAARRPLLGIMIEVPVTALAIDRFPADFYSIGSNDLTQYVMAAARDNRSLAYLLDPAHPAMLRLVENVARYGVGSGKSVSLCGEAGADARALPHLLHAGLRSVSVAPAAVGRVKQLVASLDLSALS